LICLDGRQLPLIGFLIVIRFTRHRPVLFDVAQMCVKPRKSNVSGFPAPRADRFSAACRPNSISRVLPGCSSNPELREPFAQLDQEPLGILTMLEPDDEVIRRSHDDHIAVRVPVPPPVCPHVEDVVARHADGTTLSGGVASLRRSVPAPESPANSLRSEG